MCSKLQVRDGLMSETWVITEETMICLTVIIFETIYWWYQFQPEEAHDWAQRNVTVQATLAGSATIGKTHSLPQKILPQI